MPAVFWIKAIFAFLSVSAVGLFWADYKYRAGKKFEQIDETARWLGLILFFGRWAVIAALLIGMFWWGIGHK